MAKILKIEGEKISIGNDDGSLIVAERKEFSFVPHVGDSIDMFTNGEERLFSRKETEASTPVSMGTELVSSNSRLLAAILCFFFGWLSIHNFYVGKIGRAIGFIIMEGFCTAISVLTFGQGSFLLLIPCIWWLAELAFILAGRYTDSDDLPITEW